MSVVCRKQGVFVSLLQANNRRGIMVSLGVRWFQRSLFGSCHRPPILEELIPFDKNNCFKWKSVIEPQHSKSMKEQRHVLWGKCFASFFGDLIHVIWIFLSRKNHQRSVYGDALPQYPIGNVGALKGFTSGSSFHIRPYPWLKVWWRRGIGKQLHWRALGRVKRCAFGVGNKLAWRETPYF